MAKDIKVALVTGGNRGMGYVLATIGPEGPNGEFFSDGKRIDW